MTWVTSKIYQDKNCLRKLDNWMKKITLEYAVGIDDDDKEAGHEKCVYKAKVLEQIAVFD